MIAKFQSSVSAPKIIHPTHQFPSDVFATCVYISSVINCANLGLMVVRLQPEVESLRHTRRVHAVSQTRLVNHGVAYLPTSLASIAS
jgi:hypothetical protein